MSTDIMESIRHEFDNQQLPHYMWPAVEDYVQLGQQPGDFLFSLLRNDGYTIICHADATNSELLRPWCWFMRYALPIGSYGSISNVKAWMNHNGLKWDNSK